MDPADPKPSVENVEKIDHSGTTTAALEAYSADEIKRVVRKIDWHIMPLCFLLYTFSVLDRGNLGNAKLAGLADDIDLSGSRYEWLGTAFYIAYIIFQFSSLGWKIFQPHQWVTFVVFFWGTASTLQSVCTSWGALMACRVMLGVAETMFGPGIPLYFSYFYPREYIGLRFGIFLSGAALANAYGGALAYGLSHIHSSVTNWKFLFIIEGVPTAILALACWFFFPDSPQKARFLNEREREIATSLSRSQPGDNSEVGLDLKNLGDAFKDYRNWLFALSNFSTNVSFASLPLFLPTIISEMGAFNTVQSNGLSAPPYLLCFFAILFTSFASDRLRLRGPFASFFALTAAIGYLVLATTSAVAPRYVGIFLVVLVFVTVSIVLIWNANINENSSKRAGGIWIIQTVGQCGTVLGTHMFPDSDKPYYRKGMWIGFSFSLLSAVICAILSFILWRENKRRDKIYGKVDTLRLSEARTEELGTEATVRYII